MKKLLTGGLPRKGEDITKQFGKRVRILRENKGLSQERMAESAGLHRSHLGEIERGEGNVTLRTQEKLAQALKTPLAQIMQGVGPD